MDQRRLEIVSVQAPSLATPVFPASAMWPGVSETRAVEIVLLPLERRISTSAAASAAMPTLLPAVMAWFTASASGSPKFRWASRSS